MRLIDAGALMEALEDERSYIMNDPEIDTATRFYGVAMLRSFGSMVAKQPTIYATPVVHGRWLDNGICEHKPSRFRNPDKWTIYKCSECGYSNGRRKNANYCPNCGAKMHGRSEGE